MEMAMADSAELDRIDIDRVHSGAIRREIGERLRRALPAEPGPAPARLRELMQRLAASEAAAAEQRRR
jgi:hypothetical protein